MKDLIEYCVIIVCGIFVSEAFMNKAEIKNPSLPPTITTPTTQSSVANVIVNDNEVYFYTVSNVSDRNYQEIISKIKDDFHVEVSEEAIQLAIQFNYQNHSYLMINYQNKNFIIPEHYHFLDTQNETIIINILPNIIKDDFLSKELDSTTIRNIKIVFNNLGYRINQYKDKLVKLDSNYNENNLNQDITNLNELDQWRLNFLKKYKINDYKKLSTNVKIGIIDGGFTRNDIANFKNIKIKSFTKSSSDIVESHGTHVAGIVYAINPNAKIYAYKVFDNNLNQTLKNIPKAINQAIKDKVNIINLSMEGNGFSNDEYKSLKEAVNHHIKVVIAAGNDGEELSFNKCNTYPACYKKFIPELIVVGNINENDLISFSSNYGEIVDYYTYGVNIQSLGTNSNLTYKSGTSMSAPFITGVLSLKENTSSRTIASKNTNKNIY